MKIRLSDHFTAKRLLRFTLPSIAMMIFTSIYGVVDGIFVSNFVGKTPFAAVNFIFPFIMILSTPGFMFGSGGSALIGKTLGEGEPEKANRLFSMFVYLSTGLGIVLSAAAVIFMPQVAALMGAEGQMLDDAVLYGRIVAAGMPFMLLQCEFQSLFITAEKPQLGLSMTLVSGILNMVLDALFMAVFKWGLVGAALATALSQFAAAAMGLIYFISKNSSLLRLGGWYFNGRALVKASANGSSELMSNVSMNLVSMLYNIQLIKYAGENGVSAYGVLMYVNFIFLAVFFGYSQGMAPVVSYHFGAGNTGELKNLLKKSLVIIAIASVLMFLSAEALGPALSSVFVGYDVELYAMTKRAFAIYSVSFLFSGLAIFGSGFFTALNDGVTSAIVSFLRTLVFQIGAVLLLPLILGLDGIWVSIVAAELVAALIVALFLIIKRKKFRY